MEMTMVLVSKCRKNIQLRNEMHLPSDFEVEVSVPKSAPSSKSTILRKRVSKDGVRLKWPNGVDHIWIVAEDVDSLKPYQFLSATAIDYFINRNMVRVPGSVYTCGSKFYRTIEAARAAQDPGAKAERLKTLSEMLEWSGYSYLLLPIWANKHWSFITVENAFRDGPTGLFHVNSLKGVHNSLRVFDTVKWFLFQEQRRLAGDTLCEWRYGTFNTQPQQSNAVDCGIYLLHYMDIMARKIVELQPQLCTRPRTMKDKVAEWSVGKFNTHQAEERLGSLLDVLLRDINDVAPVQLRAVLQDRRAHGSRATDPSPGSMLQVTKRMGGELLILLLPTVLRAPGCRPPAPPDLRPPYPWLRPLLLGAESLLLGTEHV
ncbi:hypothetical protein PR002_g8530 [Phytophthora rubi]|uniref:Ubiquitin-like protease family profile domain-containing protein n=2 Tax=Phytophthora rubi TaxID=129364 RepID=A0A6A3MWX3_9STRA|nr:hypothetical protein PR002_g8530 [Phytophthora rubi]